MKAHASRQPPNHMDRSPSCPAYSTMYGQTANSRRFCFNFGGIRFLFTRQRPQEKNNSSVHTFSVLCYNVAVASGAWYPLAIVSLATVYRG